MSLADLMKKGGLRKLATVTVATPATDSPENPLSVATVASVAVAETRKAETEPPADTGELKQATHPEPETGESWHGFTRRELLALADPTERADLEASPETLEAFAFALRLAETRERGERPKHYTRAAFCEHCGPVWLFPGDATRVLGCPWCENLAKDLPIPRPPVRCVDCRHWRADAINPAGGIGSCAMEAPASKRAGSLWPRGEILCGDWRSKLTLNEVAR